jgi:chromosomal replication initiation ATPase DnaA
MSRIKEIIKSVSIEYEIPSERIYGMGRIGTQKDVIATAARWKVIHALKNGDNPLSYPQIGKILKLDHSTVIYAAKKMKQTNGKYYDEKIKNLGRNSLRTNFLRNRAIRLNKLKISFEHGVLNKQGATQ